jgi:cell division protein FtsQ
VLKGGLKDNSLLLSMQYRNKSIKDIPFVETMDVEIVDKNAIRINVYEKALAGCVEYLGQFMYFDREGIIVESSQDSTEGIPLVTGLDFAEVRLHEKLPVPDEDIFAEILSITQLLEKYDVIADKIHFEKNGNVVLHYDEVRVNLGAAENLDEKIMELPNILPNLEGKKGILKMEDYDSDSETVTFELD